MKKLLISIVATASLALVAKADVLNSASFENYIATKFSVGLNDGGSEGGELYWSGGGTDPEFKWVTRGEGEGASNALSIDVEEELVRKVKTDGTALNIGDGLYFDSMVQFTATEEAPVPTDGDKLIVWLKEIPGDTPTYKLCVTAAELNDDFLPKADPMIFETSETIEPNSWHRLSIAANVETAKGRPNLTVFRVYLDSNEIVADKPFYSLVPYTTEYSEGVGLYNRISSVSFKGKGAIDDLVWTTEDPFAAPTKSYTVIVDDSVGSLIGTAQYQIGEADEVSVSLYDGETDETADFALTVPEDATSVTFFLDPGEDYEVEGGTFDNGRWVVTVTLPEAGSQITLKIIEKQVVNPFTVTIAGVETACATFAEAIAAANDSANGATITIAADATDESLALNATVEVSSEVTIDFNGKTLTSTADCAIMVTSGTLNLIGNGGITAPWVVIQQGTKNGGETTTVNVGANVNLLSRNELEKTGNNGYGDNVVYLCGKATLNVAGTLETDSDYYCAIQTSGGDEHADVAIKIEGTVINNNEVAIGLNLHKNAKGSLIVAEGAIIKGKSGIYAKSGSVTINGGTITATGKLGDASNEPGGTATGNALVVDKNSGYADLAVAVTGGTFNGYNGEAAIASVGEVIVGFVTGGTFNTEIDAALLAEDKGLKKDGDNWTVAQTYQVSATAEKAEVTLAKSAYFEGDAVTFTVTADEDYEVTGVTMNGTPLTADNGTYSFTMPATAVTIVVTTEETYEKPTAGDSELEADDFADPETVNSTTEVTLPEGWKVSEDKTQILNDKGGVFVTFPEHYSAKLVDGKVMLVLNDTVKPTIGESTEGGNTIKPMEFATDGQKDVVKLNVPGRKSFLFYGVKSATTLSNLKGATPAWATQKGVNPPAVEKSGDAQFFKVVVTDVLPAQN